MDALKCFIALCLLAIAGHFAEHKPKRLRKLNGLQFLVSVNTTFTPPHGCIATVKTPMIAPDTPWNKSENIIVGNCDNGPLTYGVGYADDDSGAMTVYVTYYSHAVLDASHPACQIEFDGNYLVPKPGHNDMSLLPGCFVMDSREGANMTYFWFKIINWFFG